MLNKLNKSNKGFTIIEVMIVLAIAGLIILIVLLAVPALQRNSRNTAIKNDASNVAGAISEFRSNNDGKQPTAVTGTGTITAAGAAGDTSAEAKVQPNTVVAAGATPAIGAIGVQLGTNCANVASPRSAAVYYRVEQSSGAGVIKCIDA
jgi:prepilin-type N-terminal cleavage/methylation domain-containing protein